MINYYYKSIRDDQFMKINDSRSGSWIHIEKAHMDDLSKIIEISSLELADIQDSLDKYEIPRIEMKDDNVIIFVRYPTDEESGFHTSTLAIILTPKYIITISPHKCDLVDFLIRSKTSITTTQKSKLLLFLLLKITQDFTNKIKGVRSLVIKQENEMKNVNSSTILALTKNEETFNQYMSALVPIRNVLEAISSGRYVNLFEKDKDLLQDLLIAIKQSEDLCSVNIKSIRSLRDCYQIIFTNDVNKTMKLLTAITIVFTIPTIIASIYGMNVDLPLEKNSHAFLIIIILSLLIMFICTFFFAKKKWL